MRAAVFPSPAGVLTLSRTYRASALIAVVVESAVLPRTCAGVVHVLASSEVSRSKSRVSHDGYSPPAPACRSTTEPMCCFDPRSTCSHLLALGAPLVGPPGEHAAVDRLVRTLAAAAGRV